MSTPESKAIKLIATLNVEAGVTRVVQSVPVLTIVAPVAASTMSVHRSLAKELVAVSVNTVERRRAEALNIRTFVVSPRFSLDGPLWAEAV